MDSFGDAYVVGNPFSGNFPVASPYQGSYGGAGASAFSVSAPVTAFLTKINPAGSASSAFTYLGGNDDDRAYAVAVDASGNVHLGGSPGLDPIFRSPPMPSRMLLRYRGG